MNHYGTVFQTVHGLFRVRCFTQDDAHIFMLPEQITDEIKGVVRLTDKIYKQFGFKYKIELSTCTSPSSAARKGKSL